MPTDMETFADLTSKAERGIDIARNGSLQYLRNRLGFSRAAMAELLHCSALTYTRWEQGPVRTIRPPLAIRITNLHEQAWLVLDQLAGEGVVLADYVPLYLLASRRGLPQEVLLARVREGEVECLDLGILGMWVSKTLSMV